MASTKFQPISYTATERGELARREAELYAADDAAEAENKANRAAIHPAFKALANRTWTRDGYYPDNAEVQADVLTSITTIAASKSEAVKAELRTIYGAIRSQGGDAYAANKARLIELSK